jgi:hypothetical protein
MVFGDVSNPSVVEYLQYLSSTSHVTSIGRVTYRCGQQIELLPGFKADLSSNFLAYIKDYGCKECGGGTNSNTKLHLMSESLGEDGGNDPWTMDTVLNVVPFVPYDIPIDTSIQVEPTDSLFTTDSINLWNVLITSGDSELINGLLQIGELPPVGGPNVGGNSRLYHPHEVNNSISSTSPGRISIMPNPNNGQCILEYQTVEGLTDLREDGEHQLMITNAVGSIVFSAKFTGPRFDMVLNGFPNGNYIVRIVGTNAAKIVKLTIVR